MKVLNYTESLVWLSADPSFQSTIKRFAVECCNKMRYVQVYRDIPKILKTFKAEQVRVLVPLDRRHGHDFNASRVTFEDFGWQNIQLDDTEQR